MATRPSGPTPSSQSTVSSLAHLTLPLLYLLTAVPPTRIQIINHLSGARLEVRENEEVELACQVSNAKPRARIVWYRNNVAFNPGLGKYHQNCGSNNIGNIVAL